MNPQSEMLRPLTPRELAVREVPIRRTDECLRLLGNVTRYLGDDPRAVVERAERRGWCGMAPALSKPNPTTAPPAPAAEGSPSETNNNPQETEERNDQ